MKEYVILTDTGCDLNSEIRGKYAFKKDAQPFLYLFGRGEEITGAFVAGVGIGVGTDAGKL